ncbi:MAG TPA: hypothetical protein VF232_12120 [Gaiellaceae bacterium]
MKSRVSSSWKSGSAWSSSSTTGAEDLAIAEQATDDVGRVVLENADVFLEDLAERPIRDPVAVGEAAAGPPDRLGLLGTQQLPELANEPRLADADVGHDRDHVRPALLDGAGIRCEEQVQLAGAADESLLQPSHASRPHERQRAEQRYADDAVLFPFRLDTPPRAELEGATDERGRPLADQNLVRRRSLLETRRRVDRVTADERAPLTRPADDDITGVHTGAKRELALEERVQTAAHRKRAMQRALRMVLERGGSAERGHDRVAGELLHRASGALDLRCHRFVEAVERRARALGILGAGERGRPNEIGEQYGRELPLVLGRCGVGRRAACRAEPSGVRQLGATLGAGGHELDSDRGAGLTSRLRGLRSRARRDQGEDR